MANPKTMEELQMWLQSPNGGGYDLMKLRDFVNDCKKGKMTFEKISKSTANAIVGEYSELKEVLYNIIDSKPIALKTYLPKLKPILSNLNKKWNIKNIDISITEGYSTATGEYDFNWCSDFLKALNGVK